MPKKIISTSTSGQVILRLARRAFDLMADMREFRREARRSVSVVSWAYSDYYRALYRLKQQGYVASLKRGNHRSYHLTNSGRELAERLLRETIKLPSPQKWDGQWRLLCFDIPETKRRERAFLRNFLYRNGFRKYQESVWITPYNILPATLKTMAASGGLHRFARTVTASRIDDELAFKKVFQLH